MNAPLIVAGCLGLLAAAIHGGAGERLVVRELSPETLPRTRFGGSRMTMAMIHVTWHVTTVAFLAVGCGLLVAGSVLDGDAARAVARLAAAASTGFALVAVALGAGYMRSPRTLLQHPGPIALSALAAFAWWGAL
jgi:hypothetical protein